MKTKILTNVIKVTTYNYDIDGTIEKHTIIKTISIEEAIKYIRKGIEEESNIIVEIL